jgi:Arc/MetJ-type ribon-helix-helix transcriptional regulator
MTTLNLTLPPDLEAYLRRRAGEYPSAEEYLRDLIQRERDDRAEYEIKLAGLRAELDIGIRQLENGEFTEYDEQTIGNLADEICAKGRSRLMQNSGAAGHEKD